MFIDYLTIMMLNLTAGLVVLAGWIHFDFEQPSAKRWVPALAMVAIIGTATGLHMVFTWPLPGSFNIVFGEMGLFFGVLMIGITLAVAMQTSLLPVAVYATFIGLGAVIMAWQIWDIGLTKHPGMSTLSFLWLGLIGLFALPMYAQKNQDLFRKLAVIGLIIGAVLWGISAFNSYVGHVSSFSKWKPTVLQYQIQMNQPRGENAE